MTKSRERKVPSKFGVDRLLYWYTLIEEEKKKYGDSTINDLLEIKDN